jgi:hypothetical protein
VNFISLHLTTAIIAMTTMAVGSAFQAALGMGMALLVVPVLALVDPRFIPGPMLLAGSVLAAMTAYQDRDAIDTRGLATSVVGMAGGTLIGAAALHFVHGRNVGHLFGYAILAAVLVSVLGVPVVPNRRSLILGGGAAGVMGTMSGIHGPAIALIFQKAEPKVARAMLGAFFTIAYLGSVTALAAFGLFGRADLMRSLVLLPGVAVGLIVAPIPRRLVDRRHLRMAILAVAAVSGVVLAL